MNIETDYLIIGAGAMGLAFVDTLLDHSGAHITIVDKRSAPGGHWNDAYSFVKLHQPSVFYGVESKPMGRDRIEKTGPNAGFMELAEGPEILDYFHSVMKDRLLPSGRVQFLSNTEVLADGRVRHRLSGETQTITVKRKTVDASYYTNAVPRTQPLGFEVAADIAVIAPNDLPLRAAQHEHFTVIGSGKTGIDACVWLLENGVSADRIRWVLGRDAWFLNRAYTQPGDAFFETTFSNFADQRRAMAQAKTADELALGLEACGAWLRLDAAITPEVFHAATISEGELALLQQIDDQVRLGHVQRIESGRMVLDRGEISLEPGGLFIACTATALPIKPVRPFFEKDRITLQMVRFPQLPFSAALGAFLEAHFESDEEKNGFCAPIPLPDTVSDYVGCLMPDAMNRYMCSKHPRVREWINQSRLDGYSKIAAAVAPEDENRRAILTDVKTAAMAAAGNLGVLMESVK